MLHLLCLSGAVYLRPTDRTKPLIGGDDWKSIARQGFEVATVLGVLSYVLVQQGGEIRNQGLISFIKQLVSKLCRLTKLVVVKHKVPKQELKQ